MSITCAGPPGDAITADDVVEPLATDHVEAWFQGSDSTSDHPAEVHKWISSAKNIKVTMAGFGGASGMKGDPDIHWLAYRGGRVSEKSF